MTVEIIGQNTLIISDEEYDELCRDAEAFNEIYDLVRENMDAGVIGCGEEDNALVEDIVTIIMEIDRE